jgi:hypothetical protein
MSQGLMILIGGVLIFLATVIPIITNILQWAMQKGVPPSLLVVASLGLVGLACYAIAFIGAIRKWNVNLVLSYVLAFAIFDTAGFVLQGGIPSRFEVASFVVSFFIVGCFVAFAISRPNAS